MMSPDNLAVYICSHVFKKERDVNYVCKEDGEWQFLCGEEHDADESPHVVGIGHILTRDPSIKELEDLPDNWEAERVSISSEWSRREIVD